MYSKGDAAKLRSNSTIKIVIGPSAAGRRPSSCLVRQAVRRNCASQRCYYLRPFGIFLPFHLAYDCIRACRFEDPQSHADHSLLTFGHPVRLIFVRQTLSSRLGFRDYADPVTGPDVLAVLSVARLSAKAVVRRPWLRKWRASSIVARATNLRKPTSNRQHTGTPTHLSLKLAVLESKRGIAICE